MNYLAHLALAKRDGHSLVGSLLPDLSYGKSCEEWPYEMKTALLHHHAVDRYTDSHGVVKRLRLFLCQDYPLHSPILIDISFDYFLIKHWHQWYDISFKQFEEKIYKSIEKVKKDIPPRAVLFFDRLLSYRWLSGLGFKEGVERSLLSVADRIKTPNHFPECFSEFKTHYDRLEGDFLLFFNELHSAHNL